MNKKIKIPEGLKRAVEDAAEAQRKFQKTLESFKPLTDQIKKVAESTKNQKSLQLAKHNRESIEFVDPGIIKERDAWERHTEIIQQQTGILEILKKILEEQRETSLLNKKIFWAGVSTLIVAILTLLTTAIVLVD